MASINEKGGDCWNGVVIDVNKREKIENPSYL